MSVNTTCFLCKDILQDMNVQESPLPEVVRFKCANENRGCKEQPTGHSYHQHVHNCVFRHFKTVSGGKRGPGLKKESLETVNRQYIKSKRLKSVINNVSKFCKQQCEDKIDVLFFLLCNALEKTGSNKARKWDNLWRKSEEDMDRLT